MTHVLDFCLGVLVAAVACGIAFAAFVRRSARQRTLSQPTNLAVRRGPR